MNNTTESACPKCGAPIPEDAPHGLCPRCVFAGADTARTSSGPAGPRTPPPTVEEVAAQFPDLEILELIGSGGMGAVYKARQPKLGRLVALKILSQDLARDPAFSERFNREARVLARLSHPNIVAVFDYGTKGPFFFLLMEFVDGVNLRQTMRTGRFTTSETLTLVQNICVALQFAHEEGILHRDIKPENILIDTRGRVKIADFGIAKLIGEDETDDFTLTAKGAVLGSPHYMAPEQIEKPEDVDERADIYSLGVVFYELLTGELPLGRFGPPSRNTPMDQRIDEVVMRTLEKERTLRYQSVGEVKTSVETISQSPAAAVEEPGTGPASAPDPSVPTAPAGTAKRATASAVLTGVSLSIFAVALCGIAVLAFSLTGSLGVAGVAIILVPLLLLVGVPAMLGVVFGAKALGEIRESEGRKRGLGRAMFGTLAWPVLVIVALTSISTGMGFAAMFGPGLLWFLCAIAVTVSVGVLVLMAVWRWAKGIPRGVRSYDHPASSRRIGSVAAIAAAIVLLPTLVILVTWGMFALSPVPQRRVLPATETRESRPVSFHDVEWRLDRPDIELDLTIAPMHVATIALVRTDASGQEETFDLQGWAIAPDEEAFRGRVLLGSLTSLDRNGRPHWIFCIEGFGGTSTTDDGRMNAVGGSAARSSIETLSGDWVFDATLPNKLELTSEGSHSMDVATSARSGRDVPPSTDTLTLRVVTRHRSGPGVPEVSLRAGMVGSGPTDWVEALKRK